MKVFGKIFVLLLFSSASFAESSPHFLSEFSSRDSELFTAGNYSLSGRRSMNSISQGAYIGGGVLGTVFGFGIGHAVQGRWMKTGWIHTVLQVSAFAALGLQAPFQILGLLNAEVWSPRDFRDTLALTASLIFLASKIWEIVDVWVLPESIQLRSADTGWMNSSLMPSSGHIAPPGLQIVWKF